MSKPAKTARDDAPSGPGFEDALAEVELIIRRIESGEVGLEQSIEQYERGVGLIKRCREVLDRVEERVTDLTEQMKSVGGSAAQGGSTGSGGAGASKPRAKPADDEPEAPF
jgi:exodeoxyribonuclease VII small subunit